MFFRCSLFSDYIKYITKSVKDKAQPLSYYNGVILDFPEDHGTSSASVLDEEGNSVVVTSTINTW